MRELNEDEKKTPVVIYTEEALLHGQIITREMMRVHIMLRTDSAPSFLHLQETQIVRIGDTVKTTKFDEIYFPTHKIIGFHVSPEDEIDLDYDKKEANRRMVPVRAAMGPFLIDSKIRISTQTELSASLEVSRSAWLSLYDATISTPYLAQMNMQVPMLLIRPEKVGFGTVE
ncbi:MAG: hypothetical protein HN392_06475 [Anaerolineae bacterium]|jgi:hypothetical protein|nr:hypothetical protein [Anaerolineae bacterium]MBT7783114.1 hypothetical protein [Anaerolineae bacterium]